MQIQRKKTVEKFWFKRFQLGTTSHVWFRLKTDIRMLSTLVGDIFLIWNKIGLYPDVSILIKDAKCRYNFFRQSWW